MWSSRDAQTSEKAVAGVFVASGGFVAQCKVPSGKTVGRIGVEEKVRSPALSSNHSGHCSSRFVWTNQRKMDALALVHHPWLTEWWDRFGRMSHLTLRCIPIPGYVMATNYGYKPWKTPSGEMNLKSWKVTAVIACVAPRLQKKEKRFKTIKMTSVSLDWNAEKKNERIRIRPRRKQIREFLRHVSWRNGYRDWN